MDLENYILLDFFHQRTRSNVHNLGCNGYLTTGSTALFSYFASLPILYNGLQNKISVLRKKLTHLNTKWTLKIKLWAIFLNKQDKMLIKFVPFLFIVDLSMINLTVLSFLGSNEKEGITW